MSVRVDTSSQAARVHLHHAVTQVFFNGYVGTTGQLMEKRSLAYQAIEFAAQMSVQGRDDILEKLLSAVPQQAVDPDILNAVPFQNLHAEWKNGGMTIGMVDLIRDIVHPNDVPETIDARRHIVKINHYLTQFKELGQRVGLRVNFIDAGFKYQGRANPYMAAIVKGPALET